MDLLSAMKKTLNVHGAVELDGTVLRQGLRSKASTVGKLLDAQQTLYLPDWDMYVFAYEWKDLDYYMEPLNILRSELREEGRANISPSFYRNYFSPPSLSLDVWLERSFESDWWVREESDGSYTIIVAQRVEGVA